MDCCHSLSQLMYPILASNSLSSPGWPSISPLLLLPPQCLGYRCALPNCIYAVLGILSKRGTYVCVCVCIRRTDQRQRTVFNQWYPISPSPKSKLNRHWLLLWPSVSLAEKAWKLEAWLGLVWMGDETWDSCMGFHIQQSAGFVLLRQALY